MEKDEIPGIWHQFKSISREYLGRCLDYCLDRFRDVRFDSHGENPTLYNVSVRGFENIPLDAKPGPKFLPVGTLEKGEDGVSKLEKLTRILSQGFDNCIVSFFISKGPDYQPSPIAIGEFERDYSVDGVIWARWKLNKGNN